MTENFEEFSILKIEDIEIKYRVIDWHGIFNYTVGYEGIYYIDPKYLDEFLKRGF